MAGQPLLLRAHGRYVCSTRTWKVLRVDVERYARRIEIARKNVSDLRFQVDELGNDLWRDVFTENPEASRNYYEARGKSETLSLLFETPREFLAMPFEFMRSEMPQEYLVLQHPLARFIHDAVPKREAISSSMLALTKKLRVLIIASNTRPPINGVDAEAKALYDYLNCQKSIPVEVTRLSTRQATYERVQDELGKPHYDVIHYAGHGSFNASSPEESGLHFWAGENKRDPIKPMKATELKMLHEHSMARLVYLSCCYGTATGSQIALLDVDFL
jgi:CHAT domain-containing protein